MKTKGQIRMNEKFAQDYDALYLKGSMIKFGLRSVEVDVFLNEELDEHTIELSQDIMEELMLPDFASYNIKVENKEIIIGPFIGILLGTKKHALNRRRRTLSSYVKYYEKTKGAIVGFTMNDLDRDSLTVNGIIYNPKTKVWERHKLPYPSSVLKRGFVSKENRQYMYSIYGNKYFNYKPIDKWEMHDRLSQFEEVAPYLPDADLYKDLESLLAFIKKYQDIYVKPIGGNQGKGIYNILKNNDQILIMTREDGENIKIVCESDEELKKFAEENLRSGNYIMQKTLDLTINNRIIDFRIGLDRDNKGSWKHNMFITRVGGDESIVSNAATSGGYVQMPDEALKELYQLSGEEVESYQTKLLEIAYAIGEKLDLTGIPLGKIALDLCIDQHFNIYLIEVNNRLPDDNLMRTLGNKEKFFEIKQENIMYAKGLAGFSQEDENFIQIEKPIVNKQLNKRIRIRIGKKRRSSLMKTMKQYIQEANLNVTLRTTKYDLIVSNIKSLKDKENILNYISKETKKINTALLVEDVPPRKPKKRENKAVLKKEEAIEKIKTKEKEILQLKKENEELKGRIKELEKNTSLKLRSPLRKISNLLKR